MHFECSRGNDSSVRSLSTAITHLVVHCFFLRFLGQSVNCHVRNHILEYEVRPIHFECSRCNDSSVRSLSTAITHLVVHRFSCVFLGKPVHWHVRNHILEYEVRPIHFECSRCNDSSVRSLSTAITHLVVHRFSCVFLGKPVHWHVRNHVLEYEVHPIHFECSRCCQHMGIFVLVCRHS